ncbi:hypothetical protein B0T16DRAFT_397085, partial [Cercophora newfieldiana]
LGIPWLRRWSPRIDWKTGHLQWDEAREERPRSGLSGSPQLHETVAYVRGSTGSTGNSSRKSWKLGYQHIASSGGRIGRILGGELAEGIHPPLNVTA